jgi:hypothetical protein
MTRNEEPLLAISVYDGEYAGDIALLAHICDIEGSVVPHGRPLFSLFEEALKMLELCAEKYSTPGLPSQCLTVFVGRKTSTGIQPLARLDVVARNGLAGASITSAAPRVDSEPVRYASDDDALTIVRKVLAGCVRWEHPL